MKGNVHSIESMGTVDGPGIRTVIFLQGCPLRCKYCHNPDTQEFGEGKPTEATELVEKIRRFIPYHKASGGGVTFSGRRAARAARISDGMPETVQGSGHTHLYRHVGRG